MNLIISIMNTAVEAAYSGVGVEEPSVVVVVLWRLYLIKTIRNVFWRTKKNRARYLIENNSHREEEEERQGTRMVLGIPRHTSFHIQ